MRLNRRPTTWLLAGLLLGEIIFAHPAISQLFAFKLTGAVSCTSDTAGSCATAFGSTTGSGAVVLASAPTIASPAFTGTIDLHNGIVQLPSAAGQTYVTQGTGDGATYGTYNFALSGWYGMALQDYAGTVHGVYDFRTGNLTTDGVVYFKGAGTNTLDGSLNVVGAVNDNGTAPTGTAGSGYVRATGATLTDPIVGGAKVSTSTLTKTSDTALATVPGLSVALTAGKTYKCGGHLSVSSGAAGGVQVKLLANGGLTGTSYRMTVQGWNGTTLNTAGTITALGAALFSVAAVYTDVYFDGAIVVNAGGNLDVQFAQASSDGTPSIASLNSTFQCTRVT